MQLLGRANWGTKRMGMVEKYSKDAAAATFPAASAATVAPACTGESFLHWLARHPRPPRKTLKKNVL